MALSQEAEAHAREALKNARRQAGLPALIDDEPTLRVIVAVIGSHLERRLTAGNESPGYPPTSTETNYAPPAKDQTEVSAGNAKLDNQAIPEDREPTGEMGR